MPILYSVISRGSTILAQYAGYSGNFTDVTQQVLTRISPDSDRMTYSHGEYLFHYVCDKGIVYLCITDNAFERSKAFNFLQYIKKKFEVQYGDRAKTALPFAMNTDFSQTLKSQMRHVSAGGSPRNDYSEKLIKARSEVDELKGSLVRNIDDLAQRGEKLELLIDRTEELNTSSMTFKTKSRNLARSLWWKNVKLTIIIVVISVVILYIIVSIACGGLGWQKCVKKK
ncbi:DgyrCDS7841 [Dimorphilus gyrociliatus]|uniref:Vesicle-associated membrane protein 7 n=1 Tax=Dimorphilus gyrociliatus TaxID=2664684 RepID=A0A7I8VSB9_9ANNE|nr:DgyrCDS7841 [Dimorphilus gyrociliatus]